MAFLELQRVTKRFDRATVVSSFSLEAAEGELVSFLGGSGCGKTTTLRMIAGFETPTEGVISIGGVDVVEVPPHRRGVGMVFQNYALFPNMTAGQNIGFGLRVAGKKAHEIRERVRQLLSLIHMEGFEGRYPHQMSGGQQQRVALARALAIQPRVLLLDEPLSALDAGIRVRLREEIRSIQRQLGITTIYVTHDQEEALSLSDKVVVMREGRIAQVGTPWEISQPPGLGVRGFLHRISQRPCLRGRGPRGGDAQYPGPAGSSPRAPRACRRGGREPVPAAGNDLSHQRPLGFQPVDGQRDERGFSWINRAHFPPRGGKRAVPGYLQQPAPRPAGRGGAHQRLVSPGSVLAGAGVRIPPTHGWSGGQAFVAQALRRRAGRCPGP